MGYRHMCGVSQRVKQVDEALTSFDKFKAWYDGLRHNVDPKMLSSATRFRLMRVMLPLYFSLYKRP